ncbi:MAG: hypothetical protein U0229_04255 [Anaeromyxobacter sp.]
MRARRLAAAVALAAAVPALAYVLPVSGILKRMGEKRAALNLEALEVTGTLRAEGPGAEKLAAVTGRAGAQRVALPARLDLKVPGRCRLEAGGPEVAEADRTFASLRGDKVTGKGALADSAPAAALVRAVCTLLATTVSGDASGNYAAALGRRGVGLADAALGRFEGKVVYLLGAHPKDAKPLAMVEKDSFQPARLVAQEGGALYDVRLLGWGSPTGGDWFPRAIEVWQGEELRLRLTTEKAQANPRLPETLFP